MDMSDNIIAAETDELEVERARLQAESRSPFAAVGISSVSSVGRKLKLMFGAAAGSAGVLGALGLLALATSGAATSGLLLAIVAVAFATVAVCLLCIRFVQGELIHPVEALSSAMRELAEGNRDVWVPHGPWITSRKPG